MGQRIALKIALGYFSKEDHNFAFPSRIVLTMHLSKKLYLSRYIVSSCLTLLGKQIYATLLGKPKRCRAQSYNSVRVTTRYVLRKTKLGVRGCGEFD